MGFPSLQHLRGKEVRFARGCRVPPSSAFRVWLPSSRLTPSKPAPAFFRAGSALGIHPSELTPPARYRAVSDPMNPHTVSPAVASAAEATGRPDRPRFLGFDPRESPWRARGLFRAPDVAGCSLGVTPSRVFGGRLERAFARSPLTRFSARVQRRARWRLRVSIGARLARSPRRQAAVG